MRGTSSHQERKIVEKAHHLLEPQATKLFLDKIAKKIDLGIGNERMHGLNMLTETNFSNILLLVPYNSNVYVLCDLLENIYHILLIVLCPTNNQVVWFCSMRKRPDVHIKTAINKLSNIFEVVQHFF